MFLGAHSSLPYSCFLLAAGHESLSGAAARCSLTPSLPHLTGAAALRNAVVSCAHLLIPPGIRYNSISLVSLVALLVRLFPSVSMSVNPWKTNKANFLNKSMCIQNLPNKKKSQIFEDILISSLVKVKLTNVDGIKELKTKGKETLQ